MTSAVMMLLASLSTAHAVPGQFTHQGRILDADDLPMDGTVSITFRLVDSEAGGAVLWEEDLTLTFTNGFYSAVLGTDEDENPLDVEVFELAPLWLEIQLDGAGAMYPRHPINSVPYATMAGVAEEVLGGPVDASEVAVDGVTVIDGDGEWVGPGHAVSWDDVTDMPDGFADGTDDDTWPSAGDVIGYITDAAIDLASGTTIGGSEISTGAHTTSLGWDSITGIPDDFTDGTDDDTWLSADDVIGYVTLGAIDLASDTTLDGAAISTGAHTSTEGAFFGDGSDGDVTISGGVSVDRAMQYANLTIESGGTLATSTSTNAFLVIFVAGTLTIDGRIDMDGRGASAGTGGTGNIGGYIGLGGEHGAGGGTPGTAGGDGNGSGQSGGDGKAGGSGGDVLWHPGGAGGALVPGGASPNDPRKNIPRYAASALPGMYGGGGSGGGGGGGGGGPSRWYAPGGDGGDGGDAGEGGGGIIISAKNIVLNSGGAITADGIDGTDGTDGTDGGGDSHGSSASGGGGGAGGGGGESGTIILIYTSLDNSGTISSSGGTGGEGGEGGSPGEGGDGTSGSNGPTGDDGDSSAVISLDVSRGG